VGGQEAGARWNHNIQYHSLILRALPADARTALDVGTGDGLLAHELRRLVPRVTGLDIDAAVLERARAEDDRVDWVQGDLQTVPFAPGSFDVVVSVATLHHLPDLDAALRRLADLTAPEGVVAVVGLARSVSPLDHLYDLAGFVWHRVLARRRAVWEHTAPIVWPPPHSYAEVRRAAARALPGARWQRLVLWRYAIVWKKPAEV
jgi:SAM-dependent methyltransferase